MRETRLSGSEGGAGPVTRPRPYPYPATRFSDRVSVGSVSVSSECSVVTAGLFVAGTEAAERSS